MSLLVSLSVIISFHSCVLYIITGLCKLCNLYSVFPLSDVGCPRVILKGLDAAALWVGRWVQKKGMFLMEHVVSERLKPT